MKLTTVSKGQPRAPEVINYPLYLEWEEFVEDYRNSPDTPDSMKSITQTAKNWWSW